MSKKWIVKNNCLAISIDDKQIYYPIAQDVYSYIYNDSSLRSADCPNDCPALPESMPSLQFSKVGAPINVKIKFDLKTSRIELIITAIHLNEVHNVFFQDGKIVDQYIHGNTWVFLTGNISELEKLLQNAGIMNSGLISMKQYLSVIQIQRTNDINLINDEASEQLQNKTANIDTKLPKGLHATLYPYQITGYEWMRFMVQEGCGCILGDEMGLGKTLQVITLITARSEMGTTPSLIIAPVSLLENWKREFRKFAPAVNVYIHHGSNRTGRYKDLEIYDVVIISYNTAVSDQSLLRMIQWDIVALDEAQNIKNPDADRTHSAKNIKRNIGIAITGTPFENHMSDIWSIVDYVAPGFLGSLSDFNQYFSDDVTGGIRVEPIISPIMIRRRVTDVAQDLPERIVIPQVLSMSEEESFAYEEERQQALSGMNGKRATLALLQKLRMFCTHPYLLSMDSRTDEPTIASSKYKRLCELLEEIVSYDQKTILFTSYTDMFTILADDIPQRFNMPVWCINGATPVEERQKIVDVFSDFSSAALLVLNPRAAGTGLNITAANHVIHYNLEWNPALEDQASARAYRRGQTKTVFVYRLYYADTVEQIVNERIERKRDISDAAIVGTVGDEQNTKDIINALMLSPAGGSK